MSTSISFFRLIEGKKIGASVRGLVGCEEGTVAIHYTAVHGAVLGKVIIDGLMDRGTLIPDRQIPSGPLPAAV